MIFRKRMSTLTEFCRIQTIVGESKSVEHLDLSKREWRELLAC